MKKLSAKIEYWIAEHPIWFGVIAVFVYLLLVGLSIPEEVDDFRTRTSFRITNPQDNVVSRTILPDNKNLTNNDKNEDADDEEVKPEPEPETFTSSSMVKIANWNLKIFGNAKASDDSLMNSYASIIDDYDIVFIQEIRNKDQTAFPKLCDLLPSYDCRVSSRAGRSTSKEQYGVIYKKGIEIDNWKDYNPDSQDRWERPPVEVTFDIGGYELIVYDIHIKPDDAEQEIDYLEDVVSTQGNVIVLGDLNADCGYYDAGSEPDFDSWEWIIRDSEDTTVSSTNCAYDRIILTPDAYGEYLDGGIYEQVTDEMSDHYLVWVELELKDVVVEFVEVVPVVPIPEPTPEPDNQESCSSDTYNCRDFSSCSEMMDIFDQCNNDPHRLDRDGDGTPCESLCG